MQTLGTIDKVLKGLSLSFLRPRVKRASALHWPKRPSSTSVYCETTKIIIYMDGTLKMGRKRKDDATLKQIQQQVQKLKVLFGEYANMDIEYMIEREPRLLTADLNILARHLMELRMCHALQDTDLLAAVEAMPSLLFTNISDFSDRGSYYWEDYWYDTSAKYQERLWKRRLDELAEYLMTHGDAHVGFRKGDPPLLVEWAVEQRKEGQYWGSNDNPEKLYTLCGLEFEFDAAEAEWLCRYNELPPSCVRNLPAAENTDLAKWCCEQRVARKNRKLKYDKIDLLDEKKFDWDGPTAL